MPILTVRRRYLALILSGEKTATIRLTTKVKAGDALTFTDYRSSARTRCTAVDRLTVRELTDEHARSDGFTDRAALLEALHEHYPALTPKAGVCVVRFELLRDDDALPLLTHSGKSAAS